MESDSVARNFIFRGDLKSQYSINRVPLFSEPSPAGMNCKIDTSLKKKTCRFSLFQTLSEVEFSLSSLTKLTEFNVFTLNVYAYMYV